MTDEQISELGPAFSAYLRRFRPCFLQDRTADHFTAYCRALLSDLDRKSVEPIALACGTAVRTMQLFLASANWDHLGARDTLQRRVAEVLTNLPKDSLGVVGVIDETSVVKKGDMTPGVQRQYLGCVGKVENGIVTVHFALAQGRFQVLLDADLYLPQSWDQDRRRCEQAGIPDEVRYQAKWRVAFEQWLRLDENGIKFDWLAFDEGYGSKVPLLRLFSLAGQRFVAEVPVSFWVTPAGQQQGRRADAALAQADARRGRRYRQRRESVADAWWRVASLPTQAQGHNWVLLAAVNETTGELKYFVSNAPDVPVKTLLAVAWRRATVEHGFRLAKQEAGLTHYEGRQYTGLMRHLVLALVVLGFVSIHTDRLRGGKPGDNQGAGVPGAEPEVPGASEALARDDGAGARRGRHTLPPDTKRHRQGVTQETAT
jgi:SRSO17 transposase